MFLINQISVLKNIDISNVVLIFMLLNFLRLIFKHFNGDYGRPIIVIILYWIISLIFLKEFSFSLFLLVLTYIGSCEARAVFEERERSKQDK